MEDESEHLTLTLSSLEGLPESLATKQGSPLPFTVPVRYHGGTESMTTTLPKSSLLPPSPQIIIKEKGKGQLHETQSFERYSKGESVYVYVQMDSILHPRSK